MTRDRPARARPARRLKRLVGGTLLAAATAAAAGPWSGPEDVLHPEDPAIPGFTGPAGPGVVAPPNRVNPEFVFFADRVLAYEPAPGVDPEFADPERALGPPTGTYDDTVSLGELGSEEIAAGLPPGSIVVGFPAPIADGPGPDFAVFENGFRVGSGFFGELAAVEVSSNGVDFARLPGRSLTPAPVGPFGLIDPTEVSGFAGKHTNAGGLSFGTPFDLADLRDHPLVLAGRLDPSRVVRVRVVDLPGSGDFSDAAGEAVYDPWPTAGSGGFDLEAVGVLHTTACANGVDDDGDGAVDLLDPGCRDPAWPTEAPACENGTDDDGDGGTDWDGAGTGDPDPDCRDRPWRRTERACGLGAELALLLPLLARLRRRVLTASRSRW